MLSPSLSSPSSSAVTIPRPGKSILKKPPPPQQSFFSLSRLTRILPTQALSSTSAPSASLGPDENLKRAHFFLPHLVTVYPISAANPPCTINTREEKKTIEAREAERRRRVIRGNSIGPGELEDWWSMDKVESFYQECCAGREEKPHPGISAALKRATGARGRALDLSGVQITPGQAATLSDIFAVEWGLRKLFLKECDLDEHILKPILHSLLIPNTLNFLSVASNRRLKAPAFKLIGSFVQKSDNLQFLDLSQNILDKKSVEYIGSALKPASASGLVSLRLDDCSLRPASLETLAQNVRTSSLRNISLRHNRISASGAVALALMIKDYPDTMPSVSASTSGTSTPTSSLFSTLSPPSTPTTSSPPLTPSQFGMTVPLPGQNASANTSPAQNANTLPLPPPRHGPMPPPPVHPANAPLQTTYTPYIPRSRRAAAASGATATVRQLQYATRAPDPLSLNGKHVPIVTSSAQGGVTMRHSVPGTSVPKDSAHGPSAALRAKMRELEGLPRLGELRTLDLRGNDIRNGITYIAQVLKRNRTLKVLNLCENKIDPQGLAVLAEALNYNLTLETLDISRNPCAGPLLDGIQALRTAFTNNSTLKRLFLSSTSLLSTGAISLAEFLPESTSLLHLDLTENKLDLAGVMALSEGLKANHTMRCLDLNIPPDDDEYARICRDILNTCVRNTEEAERNSQAPTSGRGQAKGVWGMIEESRLARNFKDGESKKVNEDLISQASQSRDQLRSLLSRLRSSNTFDAADAELVEGSKAAQLALSDMIQTTDDPIRIEELLLLNDDISSTLKEIEDARTPSSTSTPNESSEASSVASTTQDSGTLVQSGNDKAALKTMQGKLNGLRLHIPPTATVANVQVENTITVAADDEAGGRTEIGEGEEEELTTPRVDKGKGRAAPEPIVHEKVLTPTHVLLDSEDEEGDERKEYFDAEAGEEEEVGIRSPTDLSKVMVEEEAEVFRKGTVLLGPEEMEGEYAGEELRIELLEAEVQRPPPRSLAYDEFGEEISPLPVSPSLDALSPTTTMSAPTNTSLTSTQQDASSPSRPSPRPYQQRLSRSSSLLSVSSTGSGRTSPTAQSPGLETTRSGNDAQLPALLSPVGSNGHSSNGNGDGNGVTSPLSPGANVRPYAPRRRSSAASTSPIP